MPTYSHAPQYGQRSSGTRIFTGAAGCWVRHGRRRVRVAMSNDRTQQLSMVKCVAQCVVRNRTASLVRLSQTYAPSPDPPLSPTPVPRTWAGNLAGRNLDGRRGRCVSAERTTAVMNALSIPARPHSNRPVTLTSPAQVYAGLPANQFRHIQSWLFSASFLCSSGIRSSRRTSRWANSTISSWVR